MYIEYNQGSTSYVGTTNSTTESETTLNREQPFSMADNEAYGSVDRDSFTIANSESAYEYVWSLVKAT